MQLDVEVSPPAFCYWDLFSDHIDPPLRKTPAHVMTSRRIPVLQNEVSCHELKVKMVTCCVPNCSNSSSGQKSAFWQSHVLIHSSHQNSTSLAICLHFQWQDASFWI